MFFETSGDILNIILGVAIVWVVVLLSILLFHAISIVRALHKTVDFVRDRVFSLETVLNIARGATDTVIGHLGAIADAALQGVAFVGGAKKKSAKKKPSKKK
jgi:hypothetical protein